MHVRSSGGYVCPFINLPDLISLILCISTTSSCYELAEVEFSTFLLLIYIRSTMKTTLLFIAVLLTSIVGCGKDTPADKPSDSVANQSAQPSPSSEPGKKPEMTFHVMATVTEIDQAKEKI